jgi:hypothetical protein
MVKLFAEINKVYCNLVSNFVHLKNKKSVSFRSRFH